MLFNRLLLFVVLCAGASLGLGLQAHASQMHLDYRPLVTSRISSVKCVKKANENSCTAAFRYLASLEPSLALDPYNPLKWQQYHDSMVEVFEAFPIRESEVTREVLTTFFSTLYRSPYVRLLEGSQLQQALSSSNFDFNMEQCRIRFDVFERQVINKIFELLGSESFKEACDHILIDLSQNSGGDYREALRLAGLFVNDHEPVLWQRDFNSANQTPDPVLLPHQPVRVTLPITIEISESTASAAEVFTYLLVETGNALAIGQPSYGKFTLQEIFTICSSSSDNLQLIVPKAEFFDRHGRSLEGRPIVP